MNLTFSFICLPLILLSHMTSLISPMASVVFASSKNNTVSILCWSLFFTDTFSASSTCFMISLSVVPPCIYRILNHTCSIIINNIFTFIMSIFLTSLPFCLQPCAARSHMNLIKRVLPHPVSPIITTGILHLEYKVIQVKNPADTLTYLNLMCMASILITLSTVST